MKQIRSVTAIAPRPGYPYVAVFRDVHERPDAGVVLETRA